jgi:hypothetical protein
VAGTGFRAERKQKSANSGRCLCGAVRYQVDGPLRDVEVCHCIECRRWHGGPTGYTSAPREALRLEGEDRLRWIDSPESNAHARRGFCGECGSSLFWDAPDRATISITAGTLDAPTGLRTVKHIYTADAGDWYELD